jgi:hypothetical protein
MHYTKTVDFNGNVATAFAVVTAALTTGGFKLERQDGRRLEFTRAQSCYGREGTWNPLGRAKQITLIASSRELSLEADLGGARNAARWLIVPVAAAGIGIALAIVRSTVRGSNWTIDKLPVLLGTLAPVLLIGLVLPLAMRHTRKRTNEALDLLVENAAMAARASG